MAKHFHPVRRAFSLLELLVVMAILVIVISIVIPALSAGRNAAKRSATTAVVQSLSTAVQQFKLSENRQPGYFSVRDLGDAQNDSATTGGFSAMDNLVLDLAGGTTDSAASAGGDPCDALTTPITSVGPRNGAKVNVDVGRIGATGQNAKGILARGYFRPDPKFFQRQCTDRQRYGSVESRFIPAVIDAWGSPVLAWTADDVGPNDPFAQENSGGTRARFYLASNAAFLKAQALGKIAEDQTAPSRGSLLTVGNQAARLRSLTTLTGNPAFSTTGATPQPTAPRGSIIFHSAGQNGIYLGLAERGGKATGGNGIAYTPNVDAIEGGAFDDFLVKSE